MKNIIDLEQFGGIQGGMKAILEGRYTVMYEMKLTAVVQ